MPIKESYYCLPFLINSQVYQREMKKHREASLRQTAQLYTAQHELTQLRLKENQRDRQKSSDRAGEEQCQEDDGQKDINHNHESSNEESDEERTPIINNEEIIFFTEVPTPVRHPMMKFRSNTHIGDPLKAAISEEQIRNYGELSSPTKRHSVSHV